MKMLKNVLLGSLILIFAGSTYAQERTSFFDKTKKNVFKWNYSSYILLGTDDYIFNYERMINKKQSLSIGAGYRSFPNIIKKRNNDFLVVDQKKRGGFSLSSEYRFYLLQRNSRDAPDGVYIGPYVNYYQSGFGNTMELFQDEVVQTSFDLDADLNLFGVGFQLGYQFIFKNFISVDVIVFGPSLTWYNAKLNLKGNLNADEENEAYQAIKEIVIDKYPYLENILDDITVTRKGKLDTWSLGFRYVLQIGIAF